MSFTWHASGGSFTLGLLAFKLQTRQPTSPFIQRINHEVRSVTFVLCIYKLELVILRLHKCDYVSAADELAASEILLFPGGSTSAFFPDACNRFVRSLVLEE